MQWAFEDIKKMIADAVALVIPDIKHSFVLVTDCSGKKFKLVTDHQAFQWLKSLNTGNEVGRRGRWFDLLQQFDMEIIAKKGRSPEMWISYFLSRVNLSGTCTDGLVLAVEDNHEEGDKKQLFDLEEIQNHQNICKIICLVKEAIQMGTELNLGATTLTTGESQVSQRMKKSVSYVV